MGRLGCEASQRQSAHKTSMNLLHIALHDGFRGHTVIITVNGDEVYRKSGVTTDLTISRADGFDTKVGSDKARLEVTAEPNHHKGTAEINISEYPYVAVSLVEGGRVSFERSKETFRYM